MLKTRSLLRLAGLLTVSATLCLSSAAVRAQEVSPSPAAGGKLDFGNFSSAPITSKAWGALQAKNYDDAIAYTGKCIEMFKTQAVAQQKAITTPPTEKEEIHKNWALNDVGTCYFIQAKAYEGAGKKKEALDSYKFLADNLGYAQCWDTKGWFWKPGDAAKERVKAMEFDTL